MQLLSTDVFDVNTCFDEGENHNDFSYLVLFSAFNSVQFMRFIFSCWLLAPAYVLLLSVNLEIPRKPPTQGSYEHAALSVVGLSVVCECRFLSLQLSKDFERVAEAVLPSLIQLIPNSAKIMSTCGTTAIRYIVQVVTLYR